MSDVVITDNTEAHRYEATLDGAVVGFASYRPESNRTVFTHTEVSPQAEGHGVGGELAKFALEDTIKQGKAIVPLCAFIAGYIQRHPAYLDAVPPKYRERL